MVRIEVPNMSDFPEIEDLEILKLRKELQELKAKYAEAEQILKDNGLLDKVSTESDEIRVCKTQIAKLAEISDKGIPFQLEDIKVLEILVKTLMLAKGKLPVETKEKPKKKEEKPDIAKLLSIAGEKIDE